MARFNQTTLHHERWMHGRAVAKMSKFGNLSGLAYDWRPIVGSPQIVHDLLLEDSSEKYTCPSSVPKPCTAVPFLPNFLQQNISAFCLLRGRGGVFLRLKMLAVVVIFTSKW